MDVESRHVLLDLTRLREAVEVEVEVDCSEAAELLVSMWTLSTTDPLDFFELGPARLERIRSQTPPELLRTADELLFREATSAFLLGMVYELEPPRSVERFLARLAATEPLEIQLHLLGYYVAGQQVAEPEVMYRAAAGDRAAATEFLRAASDWDGKQESVERLLTLGADEVKKRFVEVVPAWYEHVFRPLAAEAMPAIERDAEAKRRLARSLPSEQLIERVAPGLRYSPESDVRKLVLFPTYWARPWVLLAEHRDMRIFCYPIGAEGDARAPDDPAALARIYKALADESRLRLLRHLRAGPATLTEAAQEIGIAKSTTHHHLAILRHSGLVEILNDDRGLYYSLRRDAAAQMSALLGDYLR
jgi:DNA-binding transcriptional ArsR family regulator